MLRGFDEDLRTGLEAGLQERGVKFIYQTTIRVARKAGQRRRRPLLRRGRGAVRRRDVCDRTAGEHREASGSRRRVSSSIPDGSIEVDKFSKTTVASIYAVGDVTGRAQLTPRRRPRGLVLSPRRVFNNNPQCGRPLA